MHVVSHNTVSLDGAVTGFPVDLALRYGIAGTLRAQAHLVGSTTARTGVELFLTEVPPEEPEDLLPPDPIPGDSRPLWAIPDSTGRLHGLMHVYRRFEGARDVVMFVTRTTPSAYIEYLTERGFRWYLAGDARVDLHLLLRTLEDEFGVERALVDSGGGLTCALLAAGLLDEVSLVIAPVLAGDGGLRLFRGHGPAALERLAVEPLPGGASHHRYRVIRAPSG